MDSRNPPPAKWTSPLNYGVEFNGPSLRACLEPGMAQINWTCATWKEFTEKTLNDVAIIKDMVDRANDIYTNRVEKLLGKSLK